MNFENKLVIVVNKDIETGIAMNALAHASLAVGSLLGREETFLQDYRDASNNVWTISGMPYIILRGTSNEIQKTFLNAKAEHIQNIAFVENMTGGKYMEQLERILQVKQEDHIYYALALYGEWEMVTQLTKKLSLYK